MVFVFQAGNPGLDLMWDREREGPGTGAHNGSCRLWHEPKHIRPRDSWWLKFIHTSSRYETCGWFNTSNTKPVWWVGNHRTCGLRIKCCFTLKRNGMHLFCQLNIAYIEHLFLPIEGKFYCTVPKLRQCVTILNVGPIEVTKSGLLNTKYVFQTVLLNRVFCAIKRFEGKAFGLSLVK